MAGEHCSSGCLTRDHESYGECLRAKNIKNQWLGGTGVSATEQRRWTRENEAYRKARKEGLSPAGVRMDLVNKAYEDAAAGGS